MNNINLSYCDTSYSRGDKNRTIPHSQLIDRPTKLVRLCFIEKKTIKVNEISCFGSKKSVSASTKNSMKLSPSKFSIFVY